MRDQIEIVFRRKVRAIWLEQGLELAAKGVPWSEAKAILAKEIAAENAGALTIVKVLAHIRLFSMPRQRGNDSRAQGFIYRDNHPPPKSSGRYNVNI